jgi:hypothetical protein
MQTRNELTAERSPHRTLEIAGVILLLIYVIAGVIYSAMVPQVARYIDEQDYLDLSTSLVHGHGFSLDGKQLTASRAPGYAFFLAAIRMMGGGFFSFRVAQFFLVAGTIVLLCRLFPEKKMTAGLLIVTGLVFGYPVLFYTSAALYPQTLAGCLFAFSVGMTLASPRGILWGVAAGVGFGALILAVPPFLFTLAVVLGAALFLKLIHWRNAMVISLAAALFVGVWTARNAVRFHQFVPIASNSGQNFLIGNCENTIPYGGIGNIDHHLYDARIAELGLDEFQADHFYRDAALKWIKNHPEQALVLYLEKAANYFNVYNEYATGSNAEATPWRQIVLGISYVLLLALVAWRLSERKRFPLTAREKLFLITYVLSAFTMAIFVTRIRYRLPYDYLIIAVIAMHLSRRLEGWLQTKPTKST